MGDASRIMSYATWMELAVCLFERVTYSASGLQPLVTFPALCALSAL